VSYVLYRLAGKIGIARELRRTLLPSSTYSHLTINGTLRQWITYLRVRRDSHTQEEHRVVADEIAKQLAEVLPVIGKLENWN
jgi:thymidylate synthase (FAD)